MNEYAWKFGKVMSAEDFNFQSAQFTEWPRPFQVNYLSNRVPYQSLDSQNVLPSLSEKAIFFTAFCYVASSSQSSAPQYSGASGL